MRTYLASVFVLLSLVAAPALAGYFVAGSFNGWNPSGLAMTETPPGSGIFTAAVTGAGAREEFKITQGDWNWSWPNSGNSWFKTNDGTVTITYDTNTYADGWVNTTQRIGVDKDPGTWTAVGDWQGWSNGNPLTAMLAQGGGIYKYEQDIAPGSYQYKAVNTGSWDAIGADARSVNADTLSFTTTSGNEHVLFWVNALNGTIKADVVPEPASLLGLTLLGLLLRRR
jgi:hypothetical protein